MYICRLPVIPTLIAILTLSLLAVGVTVATVTGVSTSFDEATLLVLRELQSMRLDGVVVAITDLASVEFLAATTLAVIVLLLLHRQTVSALFVVLSVGGSALLNSILKLLFERARPDLWQQVITETSFSFPSGHAMGSVSFALTLLLVLGSKNLRLQTAVIGVALVYVLAIGVSRMYLGVHYPTDVIAGWSIATVWVLCMSLIVQRIVTSKR